MTTTLPTTARSEPTGPPRRQVGLGCSGARCRSRTSRLVRVTRSTSRRSTPTVRRRYNFQDLLAQQLLMFGSSSSWPTRASASRAVTDSLFVTGGEQQPPRPMASAVVTPTTGTHTGTPACTVRRSAAVRYNSTGKDVLCNATHWAWSRRSRPALPAVTPTSTIAVGRCHHPLDSGQEPDVLGRPRLHHARPEVRSGTRSLPRWRSVSASRRRPTRSRTRAPGHLLLRAQRNW